MGQAVNPIAVRGGYAQFWDAVWPSSAEPVYYPQLIKSLRLISALLPQFFFYALVTRSSFLFFEDTIRWQRFFFGRLRPQFLDMSGTASRHGSLQDARHGLATSRNTSGSRALVARALDDDLIPAFSAITRFKCFNQSYGTISY
jgi:hypothetical protein